jgi:hypothetical protein
MHRFIDGASQQLGDVNKSNLPGVEALSQEGEPFLLSPPCA